MITLNSME